MGQHFNRMKLLHHGLIGKLSKVFDGKLSPFSICILLCVLCCKNACLVLHLSLESEFEQNVRFLLVLISLYHVKEVTKEFGKICW